MAKKELNVSRTEYKSAAMVRKAGQEEKQTDVFHRFSSKEAKARKFDPDRVVVQKPAALQRLHRQNCRAKAGGISATIAPEARQTLPRYSCRTKAGGIKHDSCPGGATTFCLVVVAQMPAALSAIDVQSIIVCIME